MYEGFEFLDVFGPLEVFGVHDQYFAFTLIGPRYSIGGKHPGPLGCDLSCLS